MGGSCRNAEPPSSFTDGKAPHGRENGFRDDLLRPPDALPLRLHAGQTGDHALTYALPLELRQRRKDVEL